MPFIHRMLYALRTLSDEDPPPSRTRQHSSTRRRHAVALVVTFRDLFASSGLNFLLEDMETNRRKAKSNDSQCSDNPKHKRKDECNKIEVSETLKIALESEHPLATSDGFHSPADPRDGAVVLSHDERIIASSCSPNYSSVESPSKLLVPIHPGSGRVGNLTVLLSAEDEKETVDVLRKVLKWSPRKRSLAKFSVPLPKEEEHRAVAVVQNAVNRVKEEQEKKKSRKLKLTFC